MEGSVWEANVMSWLILPLVQLRWRLAVRSLRQCIQMVDLLLHTLGLSIQHHPILRDQLSISILTPPQFMSLSFSLSILLLSPPRGDVLSLSCLL